VVRTIVDKIITGGNTVSMCACYWFNQGFRQR